jgi:hypothetical protein
MITSATVGGISFSGSMAIWGKSLKGDIFTATLGTSSAEEPISIKNGTWTFHVIGWNGSSAMEGTTKCAAVSKELEGGEQEVNITLAESSCSSLGFSKPSFMSGNVFNPIDIIGCFSPGVLSGSSICDNSNKANISSLKVKILANDQGAILNSKNSMESICYSEDSATTGTHTTTLNLPLGTNSSFPFDIEIETFSDTNCSNFSQSFLLENNIESNSLIHETYSNAGRTKIFLKSSNQGAAGQPTPTSMTLSAPASSPGNVLNPIIVVDGLISGNDIIIYSDSNCTTPVSTSVTSAGTSHSVTLNTLGADGVYNLYAQQNLGAVYSLCSPNLLTYELDNTSPVDNIANAQFPLTHTNNPGSISLTWTAFSDPNLVEYRVHTYTDIGCSVDHQDHFGTGSTATSTNISGLSEGQYWATIEANDLAGNITVSGCSTDSIIVDTTAPIDSPANLQFTNTINLTGNNLAITWTAFLDTYLSDHNLFTYTDSSCSGGQIDHGSTGSSTSSDSTIVNGLTDGTYWGKVKSYDEAGNFQGTSCSTDSILVDISPPTDNGANLQFTQNHDNDGNNLDITWTAFTDANGITDHEITTYTDSGCTIGMVVHTNTGSSINSDSSTVNSLTDGTYWAKVTATDLAGRTTESACSTDSIIVDTTSPIDNTANAQFTLDYSSAGSGIDISWTPFTDLTLINHKIKTYTDGSCSGGMIDHGLTGNASNSDNASISGLSDGNYWAKITAIDALGNETTSACSTDFIVIDTIPPAFNPVRPVFGEIVYTSGSTVEGFWESFGDVNFDQYSFEIHNGPNCAGIYGSFDTGSANIFGIVPTALPDGDYSYKIIAKDLAGNQTVSDCSKHVTRVDSSYVATGWNVFLDGSEPVAPPNSRNHTAYFDPLADKLFLFGGTAATNRLSHYLTYSDPSSGWYMVASTSFTQSMSGEKSVFFPNHGPSICTFGGYQNGALKNVSNSVCFTDGSPSILSSSGTPPSQRMYHSMTKADNSDEHFCVWGGFIDNGGTSVTNSGSCYQGSNWNDMTTSGAPPARGGHTAVWTGQKVCIWGGGDDLNPSTTTTFANGACYDPASPGWTNITTTNAPSPRMLHSAVWTGRFMCVYGGVTDTGTALSDGGCYDPVQDYWMPFGPPSNPPGAVDHSAIWTGSRYCIAGGSNVPNGSTEPYGKCYSPYIDDWLPMNDTNFPDGSGGAGYFDGNRFCIHGGSTSGSSPTTNEIKCIDLR